MVVLPAPSRPRINIRTSFSPQSLLKRLLKSAPIDTILFWLTMLYPISYYSNLPIIYEYYCLSRKKRKNPRNLKFILQAAAKNLRAHT